MAKKIELLTNSSGGIDLLTERDGGNPVLILTGKKENSIQYWKRLKQAADKALARLQS